jgi:SCP-2 sterol transfer family
MDATVILADARAALDEQGRRFAALVGSLPTTATPIVGSEWTIRQAAVHWGMGMGVYAELATGTPSPIESLLDKAPVAAINSAFCADVPETDPGKLAGLILDGLDRFLNVTAGRRGDQDVMWHCGTRVDLADLAGLALGEYLIHGYDVATTVGRPWPIAPEPAALALRGYLPMYALIVNPQAASGLTATYRIELRGGEKFTVRFTDGAYRLEPPASGPVDCTITADPVAFLLVVTGRLPAAAAIALGLWRLSGEWPELALGFTDLFVFP